MGKWGGWRRRSRRGGSGFWRLPPFALPFCPAPRRGGSEFQPLPTFTLPFRLLAGFKGNGFRLVSLFALPFALLMWFVSLDKKFLFLQAESNFLSETDLFRQKKTFRARETHAQKVLFNNFCSVDPGFFRIVLTKSTPDFSNPELLPLCRLFLSYHVFFPM